MYIMKYNHPQVLLPIPPFFSSILLCPHNSNHHRIGLFLKKPKELSQKKGELQSSRGKLCKFPSKNWLTPQNHHIIYIYIQKSSTPISQSVKVGKLKSTTLFNRRKMCSRPFYAAEMWGMFLLEIQENTSVHKMYQFADSDEAK